MLTKRHNLSQDILENLLSQESLEVAFNALIDASDALSLRRSITLTELGAALEQVTALLRQYHDDGATLDSITNSIHYIEEEDRHRNLMINFCGLHNHRATSSDYGTSFLQRHRLVFLRTHQFFRATNRFRENAADFMADPALFIVKSSPRLRSEH